MPARDIRLLADAITEARPTVGETDKRIIGGLYHLLGRGKPVSIANLAEETGHSEPEVESALHPWPGVYRDGEGRVVGFWGLTVQDMPPHEILLDGRKLWAWCAWDTLFLPRRLGAVLEVRSRCPVTGRAIALRVSPDEVESVEPPEMVVSFLEPKGRFEDDVITSFCHYVHFFADEAAGRRWNSEHPATFLLSPEEAFEIGRLTDQSLMPLEDSGDRREFLTGQASVLLVDDVHRATDYYRDALGFDIELYRQLPDHYGYAHRDGCHIHFAHFKGAKPHPNSAVVRPDMFDAYFWVDEVDELHSELIGRGAQIVHGPVNQGYGLREFRVRDPDGYILAFGQPRQP